MSAWHVTWGLHPFHSILSSEITVVKFQWSISVHIMLMNYVHFSHFFYFSSNFHLPCRSALKVLERCRIALINRLRTFSSSLKRLHVESTCQITRNEAELSQLQKLMTSHGNEYKMTSAHVWNVKNWQRVLYNYTIVIHCIDAAHAQMTRVMPLANSPSKAFTLNSVSPATNFLIFLFLTEQCLPNIFRKTNRFESSLFRHPTFWQGRHAFVQISKKLRNFRLCQRNFLGFATLVNQAARCTARLWFGLHALNLSTVLRKRWHMNKTEKMWKQRTKWTMWKILTNFGLVHQSLFLEAIEPSQTFWCHEMQKIRTGQTWRNSIRNSKVWSAEANEDRIEEKTSDVALLEKTLKCKMLEV